MPSVRDASGSGTQRLYSFRDMVVLKVVKRLLDAGVSLQNIRKAIEALRSRGAEDLAQITLISDGTTVYECRSPEEVVDLLQGGQGVFGIAISGAFKEIQGSLAELAGRAGDRPDRPSEPPVGAARGRRRTSRRAPATSWPPAAPAAGPADRPEVAGARWLADDSSPRATGRLSAARLHRVMPIFSARALISALLCFPRCNMVFSCTNLGSMIRTVIVVGRGP